MKKPLAAISLILALLTLLVLAACNAITEPEPFIPTTAPTRTPTCTLTPTITLSPTPTLTLTPVPTPTMLTPTQILGPTATLPEITNTPTRSAGAPEVEYFVTSDSDVAPGDSVTLLWSLIGADEAIIYRLDAEGERKQFWQIAGRGRLVVATRTTDQDRARFALVAGEGADEIEEILSIPLSGCTEAWFFAPPPESCAAALPTFTQAAEQSFERGRMVWLAAQKQIYVLFTDDQTPAWMIFDDNFVDGQTPDRVPEYDNPPEGMLQPMRGFGLVWRENGPVRTRLGWALQPEMAFDGAIQTEIDAEAGASLYLRSAGGTILMLAPGGASWAELVP